LAISIIAAFWFTGAFTPSTGADGATTGLLYLFLCGCIAICAMILPGISGSFILLVLGAYGTVIGMVSAVSKGELSSSNLLGLAVFAAGCVIGLLSFSKVLRWLLKNYQAATLAVLCGIMLGAVRGVWPFRTVTANQKGHPEFGPNLWPELGDVWLPAIVAVAAFAFVLLMDMSAARYTRRRLLAKSNQRSSRASN
jgi:putative membrane protein